VSDESTEVTADDFARRDWLADHPELAAEGPEVVLNHEQALRAMSVADAPEPVTATPPNGDPAPGDSDGAVRGPTDIGGIGTALGKD
jgi:hypothetical protein